MPPNKRSVRAGSLNHKKRKNRKEKQAQLAALKEGKGVSSAAVLENLPSPEGSDLAKTFSNIVNSIRTELQENKNHPAHNAAVDIRLEFNSVEMSGKNLIFKKDKKESSVALELATRILPE